MTVGGIGRGKAATGVRPPPRSSCPEPTDERGWASRGAHKLIGALDAFPTSTVAGATLPGRGRLHRRVHRRAAAPRRARGGRRRRRLRPARLAAAHRRAGDGARPHERPRARTGRDRRAGRPHRRRPVVHLAAHRAARAGRLHRPRRRAAADGQAAVRGGEGAARLRRRRARPGAAGRGGARRGRRGRASAGLVLAGAVASPLPGPSGNVEYFLRLHPRSGVPRDRTTQARVRPPRSRTDPQ